MHERTSCVSKRLFFKNHVQTVFSYYSLTSMDFVVTLLFRILLKLIIDLSVNWLIHQAWWSKNWLIDHYFCLSTAISQLRSVMDDWIYCRIDWLSDWLIAALIDCLIDWLLHWLVVRLIVSDWWIVGLMDCRIDWLSDWLIVRLIDCRIDWLSDWLIVRLMDCRIDWLSDWLIVRLIDCRIDWLSDWLCLIDSLLDWLSHWLIVRFIDCQIDWLPHWLIVGLIHCRIDCVWLIDCMTDDWLIVGLIDCCIDWLSDWLICCRIDWLLDWLMDGRRIGRSTDWSVTMDRLIDIPARRHGDCVWEVYNQQDTFLWRPRYRGNIWFPWWSAGQCQPCCACYHSNENSGRQVCFQACSVMIFTVCIRFFTPRALRS